MKIERPKTIVESYDLQNTKPGTVVTLPDDVEGHVFIVARNMRPPEPVRHASAEEFPGPSERWRVYLGRSEHARDSGRRHLGTCMKTGILLRWGSLRIGAHWAPNHKRLCLNLVPCINLWVTLPGGDVP